MKKFSEEKIWAALQFLQSEEKISIVANKEIKWLGR
jgi:hypothetical protein